MSLGLVIPVRDDGAALERLLAGAGGLGLFDQIVVVDDGSADPVVTDRAEVIRQDSATGPGPARNRGLDAIRTSHVLFFDSDDMITPGMVPLWRDLAGREFDFCLFRHADTRRIARGHWHQMPHDDALWRLAGMGGATWRRSPGRPRPGWPRRRTTPGTRSTAPAFCRPPASAFPISGCTRTSPPIGTASPPPGPSSPRTGSAPAIPSRPAAAG
ncbi:glycosyltransferase family 2 protein [Ponticoccus litoralis]|uniref:Glycosyltransferase n=1 Tax=Ponticoccus litoralis TaxID=422297 RepID=A0AAW9SDV3_9RHOB